MAGTNDKSNVGDTAAPAAGQNQANKIDTPIFVEPPTAARASDKGTEAPATTPDSVSKFQADTALFRLPPSAAEGNNVARAVASDLNAVGTIRQQTISVGGDPVRASVVTKGTTETYVTPTGSFVKDANGAFVPARSPNDSAPRSGDTASKPADQAAARPVTSLDVAPSASSIMARSLSQVNPNEVRIVEPRIPASSDGKAPPSSDTRSVVVGAEVKAPPVSESKAAPVVDASARPVTVPENRVVPTPEIKTNSGAPVLNQAQIDLVQRDLASRNLGEIQAREARRDAAIAKDLGLAPTESRTINAGVQAAIVKGNESLRADGPRSEAKTEPRLEPRVEPRVEARVEGRPEQPPKTPDAVPRSAEPVLRPIEVSNRGDNPGGPRPNDPGSGTRGEREGRGERDGREREAKDFSAGTNLTPQQMAQNMRAMEAAQTQRGTEVRADGRPDSRSDGRPDGKSDGREGRPDGVDPRSLERGQMPKTDAQQPPRLTPQEEQFVARLKDLSQTMKAAEKGGGDCPNLIGKDGRLDIKEFSNLLAQNKLGLVLGPDGKPMLAPEGMKSADGKPLPPLDAKTLASLDIKAVEALVRSQVDSKTAPLGESAKGGVGEAGLKTAAGIGDLKAVDAAAAGKATTSAAALGFELSSQQGKTAIADKTAGTGADAQAKLEGKADAAKSDLGRADIGKIDIGKSESGQIKSDIAKQDAKPELKPELQKADKPEAVKAESIKVEKPETAKLEGNKVEKAESRDGVAKADSRIDHSALSSRDDFASSHRITLAQPEDGGDSWTKDSDAKTKDGQLNDKDEAMLGLKDKLEGKKKESEEDKLEDEKQNNARAAMLAAMMNQKKQQEQAEKDRQLLVEDAKKKGEDKRRKYLVKEKDTLESIAKKQLRDVRLHALIYEINKHMLPVRTERGKQTVDPRPGTSIWLPSELDIREYRSRLYAGGRSHATSARSEQSSNNLTVEEELSGRFGSNWDGKSESAAHASMLGAAVAKSQVRRANIEKILGPISSRTVDTGRIRYIVRLGDSLDGVAAKHPALKDSSLWPLLASLNEISDDSDDEGKPRTVLKRGMVLNLPTPQEIAEYREAQKEFEDLPEHLPGDEDSSSPEESIEIEAARLQEAARAAAAAYAEQMRREEGAAEPEPDVDEDEFDEDDLDEDELNDASMAQAPQAQPPIQPLQSVEGSQAVVSASQGDLTKPLPVFGYNAAGVNLQTLASQDETMPIPAVSPAANVDMVAPVVSQEPQIPSQTAQPVVAPAPLSVVSNAVPSVMPRTVPPAVPSPAVVPAAEALSRASNAPVNANPTTNAETSAPVNNQQVPQAAPDTEPLPTGLEVFSRPPVVAGDRLMWEVRPGVRIVKSCMRWDPSIGVYREQLEMLISGVWYPVIFYEVFAQNSVRHEYMPGGKRKSVRIDLPPSTVSELADNDLATKWLQYCRAFLSMLQAQPPQNQPPQTQSPQTQPPH